MKGHNSAGKQDPQKTGNVNSCQHTGPSLYVDLEINNTSVSGLIDTGSVFTLISWDIYKDICHTSRRISDTLKSFDSTLISANGDPLEVCGQTEVYFQIGGARFVTNALIVKDLSHECLLGSDFLRKNRATIDYESMTLRFGRLNISMREKSSKSVCRVSVKESITVPARHEMIINGKLKSASRGFQMDSEEGMFEPAPKFVNKGDVLVARVLAKPDKKEFPIRVINLSMEDVVIYKNTNMGTFTKSDGITTLKVQDPKLNLGATCCSSQGVSPTKQNLSNLGFDMENSDLDAGQKEQLNELIHEFQDIFSKGPNDLGRTDKVKHEIVTGDARPIKQVPRRIPIHLRDEVEVQLSDMLENNIISPSSSPWGSPVVLAKKKDGSVRFCVDYRKINEVSRKDAYPIPRIDETLDALAGAKYFSTLDLASGYWQVELKEEDREKSAFVTSKGLFEFNVMPFGLSGAPGTFQRLMEAVLAGLQWEICLAYLDDVIVFSKTFQGHLENLRLVFDRMREAGLKMKPKKCKFCLREVACLGHIVSDQGVKTDPAKVADVREWPTPRNQEDVRKFMGLASYYRRFIKNFAQIAAPLNNLLQKQVPFMWKASQENAFKELKQRLTTAPVLAYPKREGKFILDTDASNHSIGAVLSQMQDGEEKVICYASRTLTKPEKNYCVTRKELLAVVNFVKSFRHYLLGQTFTVRTDHRALIWLWSFKEPDGQVARWQSTLAEYEMEIVHRNGKQHGNADALSRKPEALTEEANMTSGVNVVSNNTNWSFAFSKENIKQEQQQDEALKDIIKWKKLHLPKPEVKDRQSAEFKRHLGQWDNLVLIDDILYRKPGDGGPGKDQLLVPTSMKRDILESLHSDPGGGHLGVAKLCGKVQNRYYWCGWRDDVERFCKGCTICASRKNPGKGMKAPLMSNEVGSPMEKIALDILGPLPTSNHGNRYILVISDLFTKWTESFALPNHRAKTIAKKLVDEFICRYGVPMFIHSDQGRDFESNLFGEICLLLGMKKTRTTPYHPQSDGQVERFNRTLLDMLSKYVMEDQTDWDDHIPHVMMAYRSSEHSTTGFSPASLMLGHELRLPVDIMYGDPPGTETPMNYASNVKESLQNSFALVRENMNTCQKRQKDYYDVKVNGTPYELNDLVWLHNPAVKPGHTKKLSRPWEGPFVVVGKPSEVTYMVRKKGTKKQKTVHFNRLKPFVSKDHAEGRPITGREQQVAAPRRKNDKEGRTKEITGEEQVANPSDFEKMNGVHEPRGKKRVTLQCDGSSDEISEVAAGTNDSSDPEESSSTESTDRYESADEQAPVQRRGRRERRPPLWLRDYVTTSGGESSESDET